MKKMLLSVLAVGMIFAACHRKTAPTAAAPVKPTEPVVAAADLEAGKTIFTTKCSRCHATKPVGNWTAEGWQPILKAMIPKARLDSVQAAQVTAYVHANAKKA